MFGLYLRKSYHKIKDLYYYLQYKSVPLYDKSYICEFDCGVKALNLIIHNHLDTLVSGDYDTYILTSRWDTKKIISIYSLAKHSFDIDNDLKEDIRTGCSTISVDLLEKTMSYINDIPSLEIALLAIEKHYHKKGIGRHLINRICRYAIKGGVDFLFVEAYHECDYSAVGFYSKQGFEQKEFGVNTTKMFKVL